MSDRRHNEEADTVLRADIVEMADVGMIQRRDGARFAVEALVGVDSFRKMRGEYLEGYGATQAGVASSVHLPHAPSAQRGLNLIRTELRAAGESHTRAQL